jgi:hypothetical protein
MDFFRESVALLRGIAWPVVVLIALLVLRREVARLLARVSEVTGFGFSAKFDKGAAKVAQEAAEVASVADVPNEMIQMDRTRSQVWR